jgi:DNA mismatch repair protein MutS2
MQQILARKQRQEQRKNNKSALTPTPSTKSEDSEIVASEEVSKTSSRGKNEQKVSTGPFSVGASVRMKGQTTTGTIEQIKGRKAIVMFGLIRTTLPLDMLEPATKPSTRKEPQSSADKLSALSNILSSVTSQIHKKQLSFRQEIDVRGMRGDEALQTITAYIDDAILVGAARVRILHGTGNGILRQLIRQYLNTVPQVKSAHDEHVQLGGAGITIVELE